ncbi:MAG: DNA gyrase subunit A [Candidatus Competibacteraceae bacterium]
MADFAKEILPVNLEDEMKQSYLDYAMSVIVGRALPDVRDGLKPVHRRVLYAMSELGNDWNKPYKKSARVVGDVIGRFHPHGDAAVYDTIVRLAQPFSLRYMLVDGQGNFGCFTGDTKLKLLDGTEKSFAELAELPPDEVFYVYSVNQEGRIVVGKGRHARITRRNAQLLELKLDNGATIRCTPDHRFMLRDGSYKEAKDLTPADSLMPGYFETTPANYNHRLTNLKWLTETADTYDITVEEHHNFLLAAGVFVHNSVDGDAPAAMRYTEVRMSRIAHELLADIDKETVDFVPNYDGSEREPVVFPTRIPHLLVNGSEGIAVGMATKIPPHNLAEVIDACLALIDNPVITLGELIAKLPGPDFPTGGIINGADGIREAYQTGRGRIYVRAKTEIETDESRGKQAIIVTELPFQVNKARLIEKIAELVKEKRLEGITELRDESDKDGMRIYIELRRGETPEVVLNNLFQHTQMQSVFGINMVALVDGQPRVLNLKQVLEAFLRHRREVVTRRTVFDLRKARERAHLLEGLAVALANIDPMIAVIKASPAPAEARAALLERTWEPGIVSDMLAKAGAELSQPTEPEPGRGLTEAGYRLSVAQAQAILELRLNRLTGLEQDKIIGEYKDLLDKIKDLLDILTMPDRLMRVIRQELREMREQYVDKRRTEIILSQQDLTIQDLISEEDMVVTLSHAGYIKSQPLALYSAQRRGGRGKTAASFKEEDFIDKLFVANTHDTLLCFSNRGKVYSLKVYELPEAGRAARGRPIVTLLPLEEGERINAVLPIREFDRDHYLFFATASGTVKKTPLSEFSRLRSIGLIAVDLREGDQLVNVAITDGRRDIMLISNAGKAIRFSETDVRSMGRAACGVRGMRLGEGQTVIALIVVADEGTVLTVTENGYGKRTALQEYPIRGRGGQGVICIQTSARNGAVVGAVLVNPQDEIMLITNGGSLVRTRVEEISVISRNTQGVKLISLQNQEKLLAVEKIESMAEDYDDSTPTAETVH